MEKYISYERELLKKIVGSHYHGSSQLIVGLKFEIEEILAQPEQKPVAWINGGIGGETAVGWYENDIANLPKGTKLYTAPSKREPLSDEAICEILLKKEWKGFVELIRQIEELHGIGVSDE